jgi:hypothetical protein
MSMACRERLGASIEDESYPHLPFRAGLSNEITQTGPIVDVRYWPKADIETMILLSTFSLGPC